MIRLVVADDRPAVLEVLRLGLERADAACMVVGEATNGADALHRILMLEPDAAVLDVEMPGMDGLEVVRRLRERGLQTPVVLCSGGDTPPQHLPDGRCAYLQKPVQFAELMRVVRRVAAHRERVAGRAN